MMMANVYLDCGIRDLWSRLVDLFFSFIACLVYHKNSSYHCLPTRATPTPLPERKKMNFLNFLHRLKIARFIFVLYLLPLPLLLAVLLFL